MKKFFYLAGAAMFLASCSSESEQATVEQVESQESIQELVEIKLGTTRLSTSTNAQTRAANEIAAFNDTKIGVFAIDEGTTDAFEIEDAATNGVTKPKSVILNNALASAAAPTGAGVPSVVSFINADGSPKTWYYPRPTTDYNYTFFGYYPYNTAAPAMSGTNIVVSGSFDGSQDVMAGKAASVTNGYNAKWYRDQTSDPEAPNIEFKHLTSEIVLQFKQGKGDFTTSDNNVLEAYFEEPDGYTLTISRASAGNATCDIAWNQTTSNAYAAGEVFTTGKAYPAGTLVKDAGGNYYQISASVPETNTAAVTNVAASLPDGLAPEVTVSAGYPVFVTPGVATKTLNIKLKDGSEAPVEINAPAITGVTTATPEFMPGYKYTVVVTIHGPQAIEITATVVDWINVADAIEVEF